MIEKMKDVVRSTHILLEEAISTIPNNTEPVSIFKYLSCFDIERVFRNMALISVIEQESGSN